MLLQMLEYNSTTAIFLFILIIWKSFCVDWK